MAVKLNNLESKNRKVVQELKNFRILEHTKDISVAPDNAITEYFMAEMQVRRRQIIIELDGKESAVLQSGAMQWTTGTVAATTGVKGVGDLFGKMARSMVTSESAIKPEYKGEGTIVLEPTYKYIILEDVSDWGKEGMAIEDGMFIACSGSVNHKLVARSNLSSAVLGNEGLFNLSLQGKGIVALESNVPKDELIVVELDDDTLKVDGHFAIAWSSSLTFTVERSGKTLTGSAASGEGFVNVYKGTGKVLLAPVTDSASLYNATHKIAK